MSPKKSWDNVLTLSMLKDGYLKNESMSCYNCITQKSVIEGKPVLSLFEIRENFEVLW